MNFLYEAFCSLEIKKRIHVSQMGILQTKWVGYKQNMQLFCSRIDLFHYEKEAEYIRRIFGTA